MEFTVITAFIGAVAAAFACALVAGLELLLGVHILTPDRVKGGILFTAAAFPMLGWAMHLISIIREH